jgi:hypothetical protein
METLNKSTFFVIPAKAGIPLNQTPGPALIYSVNREERSDVAIQSPLILPAFWIASLRSQ